MKKGFLLILWAALLLPVWGQVSPAQNLNKHKDLPKIYDEKADAMSQIDQALDEARESGRFVICQVGGNWCPWCLRFAKFITEDEEIANVVKENFVYIHVNTSKANKNEEALRRLGNPGRFGYPVLVILDDEGRVMHIQNSSYLEEGNSYNHKKVLEFFLNWTRKAIEELK
jgi:thiol:disulfide interchange protein